MSSVGMSQMAAVTAMPKNSYTFCMNIPQLNNCIEHNLDWFPFPYEVDVDLITLGLHVY